MTIDETKYSIAGILGKKTLKKLINDSEIEIEKNGKLLSSSDLEKEEVIDETSINFNIGKLYKLDPAVATINIRGKYAIGKDFQEIVPDSEGSITIEPREHLVGITYEKIKTPPYVVGEISERRTTAGNLGVEIEGYIPPGLSSNNVTFRLKNNTDKSVKVYVGNTPPMKITFQFLSSSETYGAGREAKVFDTRTFSSGEGNESYTKSGTIEYSFIFGDFAVEGKRHNVTLFLKNSTQSKIDNLIVFPTEVIDKYKFEGLSNGWKFVSKSTNPCSVCTDKNECHHKIVLTEPIYSGEDREFSFDLVFTQAIKQKQFNIHLTIPDDLRRNNEINNKTNSSTILVQSKRNWMWHAFKDRLWDAFLIATLVFLIELCVNSVTGWIVGKNSVEKKNEHIMEPNNVIK